jgi:hypothetical protein
MPRVDLAAAEAPLRVLAGWGVLLALGREHTLIWLDGLLPVLIWLAAERIAQGLRRRQGLRDRGSVMRAGRSAQAFAWMLPAVQASLPKLATALVGGLWLATFLENGPSPVLCTVLLALIWPFQALRSPSPRDRVPSRVDGLQPSYARTHRVCHLGDRSGDRWVWLLGASAGLLVGGAMLLDVASTPALAIAWLLLLAALQGWLRWAQPDPMLDRRSRAASKRSLPVRRDGGFVKPTPLAPLGLSSGAQAVTRWLMVPMMMGLPASLALCAGRGWSPTVMLSAHAAVMLLPWALSTSLARRLWPWALLLGLLGALVTQGAERVMWSSISLGLVWALGRRLDGDKASRRTMDFSLPARDRSLCLAGSWPGWWAAVALAWAVSIWGLPVFDALQLTLLLGFGLHAVAQAHPQLASRLQKFMVQRDRSSAPGHL